MKKGINFSQLDVEIPIITGNYYNKYSTKNPIEKILVSKYKEALRKLISSIDIKTIYEIGSGEGELIKLAQEINRGFTIIGSDISMKLLRANVVKGINTHWILNSAYGIPLQARTIDLVLACEVLEHLYEPDIFLMSCELLQAKYYLFSVPDEPLWRALNLSRFKYISALGNTPGHINHWNKSGFEKLITKHFKILNKCYSLPWMFILASQ